MKLSRSKRFVAGFTVVVLGASFGLAAAFWTANASGSSKAKALTAQTVTVTASTGTADLYPGASGKVWFTLTNPNPYPVTFTSMSAGTVTSSDETNCPAANLTTSNVTGLTLPVDANATSAPLSISNAVTLASSAPDGCQGVTFTLSLTLTGSQV